MGAALGGDFAHRQPCLTRDARMRVLKTVRLRLRSLLLGSRVEHELADELRDHLERQIELHVAAGLSPAARARRRAPRVRQRGARPGAVP